MSTEILFSQREYLSKTGQKIFQASASCKRCSWEMTEERNTALAHLDCMEYLEDQATYHLEIACHHKETL